MQKKITLIEDYFRGTKVNVIIDDIRGILIFIYHSRKLNSSSKLEIQYHHIYNIYDFEIINICKNIKHQLKESMLLKIEKKIMEELDND